MDTLGAAEGHFTDETQKQETLISGMWLFLVTEIMFFGGLFAAYLTYRQLYPDVFTKFSKELSVTMGTINTAVLLTSSFTMALAVRAAHLKRRKKVTLFLAITLAFGLAFLGIKGNEWMHEYHAGFAPGVSFSYQGAMADHAELFFRLYFAMTGLHAVHVIIGLLWLSLFVGKSLGKTFLTRPSVSVEILGLYWHFVDLVWIFLFPLLYLVDRS